MVSFPTKAGGGAPDDLFFLPLFKPLFLNHNGMLLLFKIPLLMSVSVAFTLDER